MQCDSMCDLSWVYVSLLAKYDCFFYQIWKLKMCLSVRSLMILRRWKHLAGLKKLPSNKMSQPACVCVCVFTDDYAKVLGGDVAWIACLFLAVAIWISLPQRKSRNSEIHHSGVVGVRWAAPVLSYSLRHREAVARVTRECIRSPLVRAFEETLATRICHCTLPWEIVHTVSARTRASSASPLLGGTRIRPTGRSFYPKEKATNSQAAARTSDCHAEKTIEKTQTVHVLGCTTCRFRAHFTLSV